jgi:anaerobic dimethyl sulfoxide reductase subunit C (anchor subunit)
MNENFTSLVFFTVFCQTAVGALLFRWLILLKSGTEFTPSDFRRISLIIIVILLFLSLAIAFLHLEKPIHAFNAVNNLGKSWLSREILSLSLLMAFLLFYLMFISKINNEKREMIISALSIISGISLIYSMIKLYMIPTIISWNNPFTPVSFIITTLLCGIVLVAVIIDKSNFRFIQTSTPLIVIFIIFSLINSIIFPGSFSKQSVNLFIIRTALSVLSLLIIAFIYFRSESNKTFIWWVILFVTVFSSEILNRYIFFLSFDKSGL